MGLAHRGSEGVAGSLSRDTGHLPSWKRFVLCRDMTCRFPGCDRPAEFCDLDPTVAYPLGPKHPSKRDHISCREGIAQITAAPGAPAGGVRRNQRAGNVDNNRSASNGKRRPEGVHIGARVSALAGPNDVLVSSTLRDLVIGSGLEFEERGAHELKGVPGEWRVFAVAST